MVLALWLGLSVRLWHWQLSAPIHSAEDMDNALHWGRVAFRIGYFNVYANVIHVAYEHIYVLDYGPARLLVFDLWAHWLHRYHPNVRVWRADYAINRPLLLFNAAMEAAAAVAVFLLVRLWRNRCGRAHGTALGFLSALFLWFNPALIVNSWGRPAWDVWVLPFYLFAILLACVDWWLASGIVLAVGTMFKGQQLLVAPIFLLWPIFSGRPLAAFRWTSGFAIAAAMIVSPWMLTTPAISQHQILLIANTPAIVWVAEVIVAVLALLLFRRKLPRAPHLWRLSMGIAMLGLFAWPVVSAGEWRLPVLALSLVAVGVLLWAPREYHAATAAAVCAAALFLCVPLFGGSLDWFQVAFEYGAKKFPMLEVGGASSLAGILQNRYQWQSNDPFWVIQRGTFGVWPGQATVLTIAHLLMMVYAALLVLCSVGIAHLHKQRDPRWLIAIITPWLLYFAFAPQMHERYLLWAAGVGAVAVGVSPGMTLMVMIVSAMSWTMTMQNLLANGDAASFAPALGRHFSQALLNFLNGTYPDIGWAVMLCAAIFLYQTLIRAKHRAPEAKTPGDL